MGGVGPAVAVDTNTKVRWWPKSFFLLALAPFLIGNVTFTYERNSFFLF